jgi:murein L,D-transpeptidase YcbB/YkuD
MIMVNIKDMTAVAINKALQDIENNKKQDLASGTTEQQKKQRAANEENLNNELKRREELLEKAKKSDNLTNKELKDLEKQVNELPDLKGKRTSEYYKPTNELNARVGEEKKIAELAKLEADLTDEIKQHGNGAGRINRAATLANVSKELDERQKQYNADNGITEAQVASNPPKNPSLNADVKTVEKPQNNQNNQNKQALEYSKAPQITSEGLIAAVAPEQSQQQPKYTGALLGVGNADESVKKLQEKLGIDADGIYGKNTEAAVKRFQRANGLDDDGVVGEKTATALLAKEVRLNGVIGGNDVKNVTPQTLEDKVTKAKGTIIGFS